MPVILPINGIAPQLPAFLAPNATVVGEGLAVPDHHLVAGVPGRVIKPLAADLRERSARIAGDYVAYQQLYPGILAAAQVP